MMETKLLEIINGILEDGDMSTVESLNKDMDFRNDLNMDSFMLADLTVQIEEHFGVDVFENGIITTIGEILELLENSNE